LAPAAESRAPVGLDLFLFDDHGKRDFFSSQGPESRAFSIRLALPADALLDCLLAPHPLMPGTGCVSWMKAERGRSLASLNLFAYLPLFPCRGLCAAVEIERQLNPMVEVALGA
jgi:hypothetical protein